MKNAIKIFLVLLVLSAATAGGISWLWSIRQTKEHERETCKAVRQEFKKASLDDAAVQLQKLAGERFFTVRFGEEFPYISLGFEPRVPYDFIGLLVEEAFLRLAGDTKSPKADTDRRILALIGLSGDMIASGKLSEPASNSLLERRLDGFFLVGDYDGAVNLMKNGIPGHTPEWCASTIAKLRAHKAMEANEYKEAIKQLLIFIEYMLSDVMKDFEDSDPANGVVYSREWVAAHNYMRCAKMAGKDGDEKAKADFTSKAIPLYKIALSKAKDDEVSIKELKREMKKYGL